MFAPLVSRFMDMKRKPTEGTLAWSEPPEKEKATDNWSNSAEVSKADEIRSGHALLFGHSVLLVVAQPCGGIYG